MIKGASGQAVQNMNVSFKQMKECFGTKMKLFVLLFYYCFLITVAVKIQRTVYWCGDHACVNKAEAEQKSYFKKTMIIEKRNIEVKLKFKKNKSELDKIMVIKQF